MDRIEKDSGALEVQYIEFQIIESPSFPALVYTSV